MKIQICVLTAVMLCVGPARAAEPTNNDQANASSSPIPIEKKKHKTSTETKAGDKQSKAGITVGCNSRPVKKKKAGIVVGCNSKPAKTDLRKPLLH